jgi:hypothetical protein
VLSHRGQYRIELHLLAKEANVGAVIAFQAMKKPCQLFMAKRKSYDQLEYCRS